MVVVINIGLQCILIIMMEIIGGQEKSQSEHGEHWRQIKQDWSTASFAGSVEEKSIHGAESIQFMDKVVGAASWQLRVHRGLIPEFQSEPPKYKEKNNRSALYKESVIQDKIQEWVDQGYVTVLDEQPHCCNLLSVAEKRDADTSIIT